VIEPEVVILPTLVVPQPCEPKVALWGMWRRTRQLRFVITPAELQPTARSKNPTPEPRSPSCQARLDRPVGTEPAGKAPAMTDTPDTSTSPGPLESYCAQTASPAVCIPAGTLTSVWTGTCIA
jgi:hypothetical protein